MPQDHKKSKREHLILLGGLKVPKLPFSLKNAGVFQPGFDGYFPENGIQWRHLLLVRMGWAGIVHREETGMTARQTVEKKLKTLRQQSRETGQIRLSTAALALAAEAGIHFLLGAVLAGAVVLEEAAPFGGAMVAASGSGLCGASALLGACFGYLSMLEASPALRYASACVLTFAVAFAFYDSRLFRRPWVMPLVAGVFNGFTGIVVQSGQVRQTWDVILCLLEVGMTVGAAWCFQMVLIPIRRGKNERLLAPERRGALLVLLACVLSALTSLELFEGMSLGGVAAGVIVLAAAWQGGVAAGAVVGLALGMALDLSAAAVPLYAMSLGVAGLAAGLRRGRGRLRVALFYALGGMSAVLWLWGDGLRLSLLWETAAAVLFFLLMPRRPVQRLGVWLAPEERGMADLLAQKAAGQRLQAAAQAFRTLCDSLRTAFRPPENDNDTAMVFDRAASRVCRNCSLRGRCWRQEYSATFNALNDATPAMVERGRLRPEDVPQYFSLRCIRFQEFLGAVNEELTALFYRRQYDARIRENRAAVCRQYSQLSDLLDGAASELSRELTPDLLGDRRLRGWIAELGLDVRTAVFRDSRGLLRVEAEGRDCRELTRSSRLADLSDLLGIPLRVEREGEDTTSFIQQEPLMAVAGVAARKKDGETVSGDAGTYFKRADGTLFVLLCDGMGSGPEANRESALAVRLLEQFLQAGVETRQALTTLTAALALRGEETGGFTTVDLLQVDLFTGEGELFKLGAAPTYVRQGAQVRRLSGTALPAGLAEGGRDTPDNFRFSLRPGDCVLMVSDGVCGTGEDGWLMDKLTDFDAASPKELARELLTQNPREGTDDRTALVIRIEKRT